MELSDALARVITEEAERQNKSVRWVGQEAGNRNAVFALRKGKTVTAETLWRMSEALGISMVDVAMRVHFLRRGAPDYLAGRET